jgi:hypothetical protein
MIRILQLIIRRVRLLQETGLSQAPGTHYSTRDSSSQNRGPTKTGLVLYVVQSVSYIVDSLSVSAYF